MKKGIIFDMDGTLWDSAEQVAQSWTLALQQCGYKDAVVTKEDMYRTMGRTMDKIAEMLFPFTQGKEREALLTTCCKVENDYLREHGGMLYPDLRKTMEQLKKMGYHLYIVSNCQDGYIEAFIKAHHMEKYFEDTECWGRTRLSKGESNKILIARNHLKNPIYVGDTAGDYQSAVDAGIPFVYAAYGFGEVQDCAYEIQSIRELPEVLERVQ